ncbi:MAG: 50S ribosomal protein L25 [Candidatus Uhrbacteria bacterium]
MSISISANKREIIGRANNKSRLAGLVPAIVYGSNMQPKNISVDRKALTTAYKEAGESTLIDLVVEGDQSLKVLLQDLQRDPLLGEIIHVDFRAVDLTKEIITEIKLRFIGEAPAVKELGGTLVHTTDEIKVRALPAALVASLEVDISKLKTFEDAVRISDLVLPAGITAVDDAEDTLAIVTPPRSEAEMDELNKAVEHDVAAVAVAEKEKKTDEKAADGKEEKEKKEEKKK